MRTLKLMKQAFCFIVLVNIVHFCAYGQMVMGTYTSDKTKEILVKHHEDSLIILSPKTKKIFLKKGDNLYISSDQKDTLKITVVGDLVRDNYLGIRASDNPKRMFDFFDENTKAAYNYMYFVKENLQGTYSCFENETKIIVDLLKSTFIFKPNPKKEIKFKIYSVDYNNHKIIIWNDKKQKEEVIFKFAFRNMVIEYKGKKYYLAE